MSAEVKAFLINGDDVPIDYDSLANKPTAASLGAIPAPSSPSSGDVLTWSGSAWAAAAPSGGTTEVFWATYGTTTNADIETAYQAGKICACKYNGYTYYLTERSDATGHTFACVDGSYMRVVYNTSGTWGHDEFDILPTIPEAYTSNPAALGTASPGSSTKYAKGDHVHPKPSAADLGVIAAPSSPASGAFLVWNGSAWVAQTLSTWQASSY